MSFLETYMKQQSKRLTILLDSEIQELYSPPTLSIEQKRLYFVLNDLEMAMFSAFRDRHVKIYFVILLGYFKIKPVVLTVNFSRIKEDFYFVLAEYLPGISLRPSNLTSLQKSRIYRNIFSLMGFTPANSDIRESLSNKAAAIAKISNEPRNIFDELIAFMTTNCLVIPKYSYIQNVVSQAVNEEKDRLYKIIQNYSSKIFISFITSLLEVNATISLSTLKRRAKDFSTTEIQKEIFACKHIRSYFEEINSLIQYLEISKHNVEYYAGLVDYYTITKLRRFHISTSTLYLLCYLQKRFNETNERMCDAFIYHCRKLEDKAKEHAKEKAYQEWKISASSVTQAGKILALFIDKNYTNNTPFGVVKKKAFSLIKLNDVEPLCRYLQDQKLGDENYLWQYFDAHIDNITSLLRPLFVNLTFYSSEPMPSMLAQIDMTKKCFTSGSFSILIRFDFDMCSPQKGYKVQLLSNYRK